VATRGRYQVRLFDAYGFSSDAPATFIIDPIEDQLPVVRITRPGPELAVTPATRLHLAFETTDDFGVTEAAIHWQKRMAATQPASAPSSDAEVPAAGGTLPSTRPQTDVRRSASAPSPPANHPQLIAIPVPRQQPQWEGGFIWELGAADLLPGDEVEYHIEVRDAGEHLDDEKLGRSARHVLRVVEPQVLAQALEARLSEAFTELDELSRQQASARDEVSAAAVSVPLDDEPLVTADVQRVQSEANRQTRLRRQVERLAVRIGQIADELGDSYLADAARITELRELSAALGALAAGPMDVAAETLRESQDAMREWVSGAPK
jgi:hypothetical protein